MLLLAGVANAACFFAVIPRRHGTTNNKIYIKKGRGDKKIEEKSVFQFARELLGTQHSPIVIDREREREKIR